MDDILDRWAQHFEELLDADDSREELLVETQPIPPPPCIEEIESALRRLKRNKAPGADGIESELLIHGGRSLIGALHGLINKIWDSETMPSDWHSGIVCPIHKKGEVTNCQNYRGITLLSAAYKVFSFFLTSRLAPYARDCIGKYQCGFTPGKSTTDQIFSLRQSMEKLLEYGQPLYHLFIDYKAAYDSIARVELYTAMSEFGIPSKLIRLTRMTMTNVNSQVKVAGSLSRSFPVRNGLRQGDGLACVLFNLALEKVIRDANIYNRGTILHKSTQLLAYADDIDIMGRNLKAVQETFTKLKRTSTKMGLEVNVQKTKILIASSVKQNNICNGQQVNIAGQEFEAVSSFCYLGSTIPTDNSLDIEVRTRLLKANRAYFSLIRLFRSKTLKISTKLLLYRTMVLPVLMYSSETWALSQKQGESIAAFERKILRRIFGPVHEVGRFRSLYNHEVYERYNGVDVVKLIRLNRLRWAGHLYRMSEDDPARKVFSGSILGMRRRGRPCLRWKDGVDQDAKKIGMPNWQQSSRDRAAWRSALRQAKTGDRL